MTAFIGEYSHSIDAKGRLTMPSRLREQLGELFYVTKGFDGCLFVFDEEGWQAFEEKVRALPMDNAGARKLSRFFLAGASRAEVDKQGRILLPESLLTHAALDKEAVVIGAGNRVEIWSKERWDATSFDDIDDVASQMSAFGLSI
ncbi:MAG: division/cell wall cluster transcriptional repressor MraZ [Butyrivibrio sp.]|nr:division/cell wall cluster transcriptional repressor MraZ [Butyrivibrio sp.]